ncbi:MAG TPA: HsdR family type I site-specific deoxyribonuclease [Spirochaetia bacterium]|nr:type I restriction endonuclease subunit R [Spirochaetaceae bacterium]HPE88304.1 HsdR family type I site-specific deoxyribonuclease [Spirochaetales bacterium]HRW25079.1 HsdR family type I site-specific deoxyribonuclease [Spirochaetia bacterium]
MTFTKEADFEDALVEALSHKGWEGKVLENPTEEELLRNWAAILFDNNRGIDRLGDSPLTDGEMRQIMEQIAALRTPLRLNGFINGKTVSITRDNPEDRLHVGKEVSLKIYDRREIAAGQSRYQIARQPRFASKSKLLSDRRGDLALLINGMPVIHIELKRSGQSVSQAYHQIEKYSDERIFSGLFSLVQIFVAMTPDETLYFANPGPDGTFNDDYYFHWADFNNEPIDGWKDIASSLLSIPMAHQLIGFYTVADASDGVLKVMRSYQYYAANAISDRVSKIDWSGHKGRGGFVWHTTGSGKTMTSFKSAQLIANSKDADKVVFLMDRIELGTQSLKEYRSFAEESEEVQATENTKVLITKLKSSKPADTLIVTSIQKMSNIKDEDGGINARDLALMQAKRIVFIIDEAHRDTFGKMLLRIKATFPRALLFGFTGTPIQEENQKKDSTTSTIFGDELHRYSIADGIRDGNVLGFDPYKVLTYKDRDLRLAVALEQAKAIDEAEAIADPKKKEVFYRFLNDVPMAGYVADDGQAVKGIEDYLPTSQYDRDEHREKVVEDILANWLTLSRGGKFHGIFATSSIPEAIEYYRLLKAKVTGLKISALFDPNIDNSGGVKFKEDGLVEIISDYNARYGRDFSIPTHAQFKKDIASRLAHKDPYIRIERTPEKQIDLLIVVDQMLTGFDSKWINTLYLDKLLRYENVIQAFSRTNRLFGPDKPFGTVRYYRKPHTMEENINKAVKLYSGDKPLGLFVDRLDANLRKLNASYRDIAELFARAGLPDMSKLPQDVAERGKFAKLFKELTIHLEASKIQGFTWNKSHYEFDEGPEKPRTAIDMLFDENDYLALALRYKELSDGHEGAGDGAGPDVPYDIDGYLTEIDTGKIDADYMNSRFDKYLKTLNQEGVDERQRQQTLDDLHKSFAYLSLEEQKYANLFLHEVESGYAVMRNGKTFRDYITDYQCKAKDDQISTLARALGLNESMLRGMMNSAITEATINEFGRFDELKATVDKDKAKEYFERHEGTPLAPIRINIKVHNLLQHFITSGGFDLPNPANANTERQSHGEE